MTTNQAEEKLIKARIKLQSGYPFFSYLSLYLKFRKSNGGDLPNYAGMGVSPNGTLTYKEKWVNELTDEECIGVLCLTPNTLIEGKKTKEVRHIKTGDLVLNKFGKLEKVGKLFKRKINENIYNIKPQNMLPIQTTKEHPFLVKQYIKNPKVKNENRSLKEQFKNVKEKWINAEDIKENHLIAIPKIKGTFNKKKIDLKEFYPQLIQRQTHIIPNFNLNKKTAWLLGLYVADGSKGDRSLRFNLNNYSKNKYFNKLKKILKEEFKITHTNTFQIKDSKAKCIDFSSTLLTNAFSDFCGENAKNKKIPHFILYNKDKEILKSFLEGYGNGDGFYYEKQKQMQYGTVSKVLAQQLQLAYLRLGKLAHIYNYKRNGVYHKIRNTILKNLNIFQIIVKDEKKKVTFINDKNCVWVKVKKITKEKYKGYVHNFETIETHTYTANNIILHNCHEILHLAFLHMIRRGSREHEKWNIAIDLAINSILKENGFDLPKNGLIPDSNSSFKFPLGIFKTACEILNINKKTGEEIYEELPEMKKQNGNCSCGKDGDGNGCSKCGKGFDEHQEENKDKDGKSKKPSQAEKQELENEWLNRLEEAYVSAKQRGKLPLGMERYIDEIKKSQISWKVLLQKLIQATIPRDYTYMRRGKKSMATKTYFPSTTKEKIDICIGIDLSGSIGKEELTEFMSEVIGMAKAYQNSITMRLLTHDVDVHNDYVITNGNIAKIKKLKLKGGGGTSHEPIFKYIDEKVKDCKAVVFFTDGYSDLEGIDFSKHRWKKIFVINKHGNEECVKGRKDCVCIKMKEDRN